MAVKLRVMSQWPAAVQGAAPITVTKLNGIYTIGMTGASSAPISVKNYGAKGDGVTDDRAAIVLALAAAAGKGLYFPAGVYCCSNALTIATPTYLFGEGPTASVLRFTSPTSNGVVFAYPTLLQGGGVSNMTIESGLGLIANGSFGAGSTGTGLLVQQANDLFFTEHLGVNNFANSMQLDRCWNTHHNDFRFMCFSGNGLGIGIDAAFAPGGGNKFSQGKISNAGYSGTRTASAGLRVRQSGGDWFGDMDITSANNGVLIDPAVGKQVAYLDFSGVSADSSLGDGWLLDGTNGDVVAIRSVNCWGSFNGYNGLSPPDNAFIAAAAGLHTQGANLEEVSFENMSLRENGGPGWHHEGGTYVELVNPSITRNSQFGATTTSPGVEIAANVSTWGIVGGRIGNFTSALGNQQGDGIHINAGVSNNFRIIGALIDFGSGKLPLVNGSTGTGIKVEGCLPLYANVGLTVTNLNSAATVDIGSTTSPIVRIVGTTTITAFSAAAELGLKSIVFSGILQITHGASLILPGATNITTAANDMMVVQYEMGGVWRCISYRRAATAVV